MSASGHSMDLSPRRLIMPIPLVAVSREAPDMLSCMTNPMKHCIKHRLERGIRRGIQQHRFGIQLDPALSQFTGLGLFREFLSPRRYIPLLKVLIARLLEADLTSSLPSKNTGSRSEKALTMMSGPYPYSSASCIISINLSMAADSRGGNFPSFYYAGQSLTLFQLHSQMVTNGPSLGQGNFPRW